MDLNKVQVNIIKNRIDAYKRYVDNDYLVCQAYSTPLSVGCDSCEFNGCRCNRLVIIKRVVK